MPGNPVLYALKTILNFSMNSCWSLPKGLGKSLIIIFNSGWVHGFNYTIAFISGKIYIYR